MSRKKRFSGNGGGGVRGRLHLFESFSDMSGARLVSLPADILEELMAEIKAIVRAHADCLDSLCAELFKTAEKLLASEELDAEGRFSLAVTLMMLHGPVGLTESLLVNGGRKAGVVKIDRAELSVWVDSVPIAQALSWVAGTPSATH